MTIEYTEGAYVDPMKDSIYEKTTYGVNYTNRGGLPGPRDPKII